MRTLNLLATAAPALLAVSCAAGDQQPKQPNVLLIIADDLGYGDVSAYGATALTTPNMDRLANGGIRFTDGHSTSATSTPSRFALFTGLYPWRVGAHILPGDAPLLIPHDSFTMPRMFQQAGYATGAIGKWHLGMGNGNLNWNEHITPGAKELGFDYSCLIAATNDRVPTVYVENGDVVGLDPNDPIEVDYKIPFEGEPDAIKNPEMLKMDWSHGHNAAIVNGIPRIGYMKGGEAARWVDEDMADYFVSLVKNFIDDNKEKPFFLYYGLHQPHVPRAPHSRFVGKTNLGPRGDAIMEADWCVGEAIAKLEKEGLLENTIIIFSSDNGPVLDDGYKDGAIERLGDHRPAGDLRGSKYSLFDGGTRVPFFVYWKGKLQPMVSDALISQMDIVASLGKLIGAEVPAGLDAEEHLDVFMGEDTVGRDDYIVEANFKLAYRSGKYAMIPAYNAKVKPEAVTRDLGFNPEYTLYNLASDKGQQTDISKSQPELFEKLKASFLEQVGDFYSAASDSTKKKRK